MFGAWKVRDEKQDRAQSAPPKKMIEDFHRARSGAAEQHGKYRTNRLKHIAALQSGLAGFKQQSATDMEDDKTSDQSRIAKNARAHFGLYRHIVGKREIFGTDKQPANQHANDPGQHACRQQVGEQVEQIPCPATRVQSEKAFEHIHQIDQKIEHETVENQRMQERNERPGLKNGLLGEDDPQSTHYPFGQTIEARIGLAARDRPVDVVDSAATVIERAGREQHK